MSKSKLVAFGMGVSAGVLIGAGAMTLVNAWRRPSPMPEPMPVEPPPPRMPEPWAGYEAGTVDDIKWKLRPLSLAEREIVRAYEKQREIGPRKGIINVLNALEEERANGNA